MIFDTSASEGAILTLPEGAFQEDVHNMTSFREYMAQHIETWYRFANGPRGREAKNGDIRLVTGCDKSTSWGIASFSNHSLEPFQRRLKMTLLEDTSTKSNCNYKWEQSGPPAAVKAGPEKSEQRSALGDQPSAANQCVFVRTLNALLSEDAWAQLSSPVALYTQNSSSSNLPSSEAMSNGSPGSPSVDTLVLSQISPHTNSTVSFASLEGNMFDSSWRDRQVCGLQRTESFDLLLAIQFNRFGTRRNSLTNTYFGFIRVGGPGWPYRMTLSGVELRLRDLLTLVTHR